MTVVDEWLNYLVQVMLTPGHANAAVRTAVQDAARDGVLHPRADNKLNTKLAASGKTALL